MNRRLLLSILVASLIFGVSASNAVPTPSECPRVIDEASLGAYWDYSATFPVQEINWGAMVPGGNNTITVYLRNEGNVNATLLVSTGDWAPSPSEFYSQLVADFEESPLEPNEVRNVTLILSTSPSITLEAFSFNLLIEAIGCFS